MNKKDINDLFAEQNLNENEILVFKKIVKYLDMEAKGETNDAKKQIAILLEGVFNDNK